MRFGIVGPISKDRVLWQNGDTVCKFGAVTYSVIALAKLLEGTKDDIVCLSHVSPDDMGQIQQFFKHPNIILTGQNDSSITGTSINLRYVDQHERVSHQTQIMTPITAAELNELSNCNYIILMPLNETDIPLDQLQEFRRKNTAMILLDVHGLVTAIDDRGTRNKQKWMCSKEWLGAIDILKMNDKEASWASSHLLSGFEDYLKYALSVVKVGLLACWITFGDKSSLIVWRRQDRIFWANVPVTDAGEIVDTIGCGDSASAGFIYAYAKLHSPLIAVVMGNMIGSVKASIYETSGFPTRPEVRSMIYQHYREYLHNLLDEFLSQKHLIVNEMKEDLSNESFVYGTNGDRYNNGTDNARSSHSEGTTTPWT